jgi:hypothetical protein
VLRLSICCLFNESILARGGRGFMRGAPQNQASTCTVATGVLGTLIRLPVSARALWARRWHIARTGNLCGTGLSNWRCGAVPQVCWSSHCLPDSRSKQVLSLMKRADTGGCRRFQAIIAGTQSGSVLLSAPPSLNGACAYGQAFSRLTAH